MNTKYKGFNIETSQDSLGDWRATVSDPAEDGMAMTTVPKNDRYGVSQEQNAVYAAKGFIEDLLSKGY